MIRPVNFRFNTETAVNNSFQQDAADQQVQEKAAAEFDSLVAQLRSHGIRVTVVNDTPDPYTPDSIFPNNWVSFHASGRIYLYPMFAANRRLERKQHVIEAVQGQYHIRERIDLSGYEQDAVFLEGTGSMVLDRENKIAYACLSPRTHEKALQDFCERENYRPIGFTATDEQGQPIYHTNVMMCVADRYVVICADSIQHPNEKEWVLDTIIGTGKQVIPISRNQMNHFAGNMLQVCNASGEPFLVMSTQAYRSLSAEQLHALTQYNAVIHSDISDIETNGGGSARCMIAEIFLPEQS
ncbi:amidinotransferase [Sediminibacterium sp. WSJ-3]|nr:amidinotransferase [Sediminibacterium soli]